MRAFGFFGKRKNSFAAKICDCFADSLDYSLLTHLFLVSHITSRKKLLKRITTSSRKCTVIVSEGFFFSAFSFPFSALDVLRFRCLSCSISSRESAANTVNPIVAHDRRSELVQTVVLLSPDAPWKHGYNLFCSWLLFPF